MLCLTTSFFLPFLRILRAPSAISDHDQPAWGHTLSMALDPFSAQTAAIGSRPRDSIGVLISTAVSLCFLEQRKLFLSSALWVSCLLDGQFSMSVVALPLPSSAFVPDLAPWVDPGHF